MSSLSEVFYAIILILVIVEVIELIIRFAVWRNVMLANRGYPIVISCLMILFGISVVVSFLLEIPALKSGGHSIFAYLMIGVSYIFMVRLVVAQENFLKQRMIDILEIVIGLNEAGDQNLKGHSLHVMNLATLFYNYLPFAYKCYLNADDLRLAALLLDLGKLGIPREILNKSGKLSKEEYEVIKHHPDFGARVLNSIGSFDRITEWILYHHERYDGTGYHHKKGDEIPLASKIIALADTYSALTMDRSYKATMSHEDAIAELRLVAGSQLDGELVDIFCEIPKKKINVCLKDVRQKMKVFEVDIQKEQGLEPEDEGK